MTYLTDGGSSPPSALVAGRLRALSSVRTAHYIISEAAAAPFWTPVDATCIPEWLSFSELTPHAMAPVRDPRVAVHGALGWVVQEDLIRLRPATYLVVTDGVEFVGEAYDPDRYAMLTAVLGPAHAAWLAELDTLRAARRAGEKVDDAVVNQLTEPRVVATCAQPVWPAELISAASTVPVHLTSVHLEPKQPLPWAVRRARDRQLTDWIGHRKSLGMAGPPLTEGGSPSLWTANWLSAQGAPDAVADLVTMIEDPVSAAQFRWPSEHRAMKVEVKSGGAGGIDRATSRRLLQLHGGTPTVALGIGAPPATRAATARQLKKATYLAAVGLPSPWQPAANDYRSLSSILEPWQRPLPTEPYPDWHEDGTKPVVKWAPFEAAHRAEHECQPGCAAFTVLMKVARDASIMHEAAHLTGAARAITRLRAGVPADDAISKKIGELIKEGILAEATPAQLASGVSSMSVFSVTKSSFPLPAGLSDDEFDAGNDEHVRRLHDHADDLVDSIMHRVEGGIGVGDAIEAGRTVQGKSRVVWNGSQLSEPGQLRHVPFGMPSPESITSQLHEGDYLVVIDLKSCFHSFVVRPEDRRLLGVRLQTEDGGPVRTLVWLRLPFGARTSPVLTCFLTSAWHHIINWIALKHGGHMISTYVDDTVGAFPSLDQAKAAQAEIVGLAQTLGLQIAEDKLGEISQRRTFLGWQVDTRGAIHAAIPASKRLKSLVAGRVVLALLARRATAGVPKPIVAELAGRLVHAAALYHSAKPYSAALYYLLDYADHGRGTVCLERLAGVRRALEYWCQPERSRSVILMARHWRRLTKAASLAAAPPGSTAALTIKTDASGEMGFGGTCAAGSIWGVFRKEYLRSSPSSTLLEVYALVSAVVYFSRRYPGRDLYLLTDNASAVAACNGGSSSSPPVRQWVRALYAFMDANDVQAEFGAIPREANKTADALSNCSSLAEAGSVTGSCEAAPCLLLPVGDDHFTVVEGCTMSTDHPHPTS